MLQKQLKQLIVLITEKLRSSLENNGAGESRNMKTNRKVKLLHQALLIFKWITDFEMSPPQITGIFDFDGDIRMTTVPPQLHQWESQISAEISKNEMMKLSPNNREINDKIKSHFSTIYGGQSGKTSGFMKSTRLGKNAGVSSALRAKHSIAA